MEEPGLPLAQWPQVLRGSALHTQIHFVQGKVEKNPTGRIKRKNTSGQGRNIQEEQNVGMKQQEVSLLLLFQICFFL